MKEPRRSPESLQATLDIIISLMPARSSAKSGGTFAGDEAELSLLCSDSRGRRTPGEVSLLPARWIIREWPRVCSQEEAPHPDPTGTHEDKTSQMNLLPFSVGAPNLGDGERHPGGRFSPPPWPWAQPLITSWDTWEICGKVTHSSSELWACSQPMGGGCPELSWGLRTWPLQSSMLLLESGWAWDASSACSASTSCAGISTLMVLRGPWCQLPIPAALLTPPTPS